MTPVDHGAVPGCRRPPDDHREVRARLLDTGLLAGTPDHPALETHWSARTLGWLTEATLAGGHEHVPSVVLGVLGEAGLRLRTPVRKAGPGLGARLVIESDHGSGR